MCSSRQEYYTRSPWMSVCSQNFHASVCKNQRPTVNFHKFCDEVDNSSNADGHPAGQVGSRRPAGPISALRQNKSLLAAWLSKRHYCLQASIYSDWALPPSTRSTKAAT